MNNRTIMILAFIFLGLVLVSSFALWGKYVKIGPENSSHQEIDVKGLAFQNVSKVTIDKKDAPQVILEKKDNRWLVNGFEASAMAVQDFFDALGKMEIKNLVSSNSDNYGNFGLSPEVAYTVAFRQDGQDRVFAFGQAGYGQDFYIKKQDGQNVYAASGELYGKVSRPVLAWRDKIVVDVPKDKLQKIEIIGTAANLILTKGQDGKWGAQTGSQSAVANSTIIDSLLMALNPLVASDFLSEQETSEFTAAKNKVVVRLYSNSGELLADLQAVSKTDAWWVKSNAKDTVYKISNASVTDILKDPKKLLEQNR